MAVATGVCALLGTGCASDADALTGAPDAAPPRATLAFALPADATTRADAEAIAARNNPSLSPRDYPDLTTTSWPDPARRHELRRVPIIYSRWGRSF